MTVAARDDAELEAFALNDDGATAALLWNVAGRGELSFLDLATGESTAAPPLPAEVGGRPAFSRDGRFVALSVTGARAPLDIWTLDRAAGPAGQFRQVTRSPHAGVPLDTLVRPELARFRAHDGLELSGWLYRPATANGPGPVVIDFHGGPEGQARPLFSGLYQALLGNGIAVLAPNVRGSSGFGKAFVNLDNGALRVDAVRDIDACVGHVVSTGVADPRRVEHVGDDDLRAELPQALAAAITRADQRTDARVLASQLLHDRGTRLAGRACHQDERGAHAACPPSRSGAGATTGSSRPVATS